MLSVAREEPPSEQYMEDISDNINNICRNIYQLYHFSHLLPDDEHSDLVKDHIESDIHKYIPIILKLGVLKNPTIPIETYIRYVTSQDKELLPFVMEFVDTTFTQDNRKLIMPIIDYGFPVEEKCQIGLEVFKDLTTNLDDILLSWIHGNHRWKEATSLSYIIKSKLEEILKKIDWDNVPETIFISQLFNRIEDESGNIKQIIPLENYSIKKESDMYSILEKTILLKSVEIFKNIPGDVLTRISQISEEIYHSEETLMFSEGDYGDSMFVVIDGNVRIHKGDHHIVTLGKSTVLGDMALLDQEPRSADATAEAETTMLKISQDGFYELMAGNSEIMQQIIKMLSGRLRDSNIKLQEAQKK
jgi:hypothetical protein